MAGKDVRNDNSLEFIKRGECQNLKYEKYREIP